MTSATKPFLVLSLLAVLSSGCIGFTVGTDDDEFFRMRGLGTAYAAMPGIDDYDGKIIKVGLLSSAPAGAQLAGIDVWPLVSVGVGVVGARVRVLPFEVGAGVLFYEPRPVRRDLSKSKKTKRAPVTNEVHGGEDVPIRRVVPDEAGNPEPTDGKVEAKAAPEAATPDKK